MISKFTKRIISFTVLVILVILSSFLFFSTPFIISEDPLDITNISSMKAFLDVDMLDRFDLNKSDLADLTLNVHEDRVEFSYDLRQNFDGFSFNYLFLPPGTEIQTAPQLLNSIPSADAVTTLDEETGRLVNYISLRGGRGRNFTIKPLTVYEVSVTQNTSWIFSIPL